MQHIWGHFADHLGDEMMGEKSEPVCPRLPRILCWRKAPSPHFPDYHPVLCFTLLRFIEFKFMKFKFQDPR